MLSPIRWVLQACLEMTKAFLPRRAFVKQISVEGRPVVVWLNEHIGRRLFVVRSFEASETALFRQIVRPDDVVLDIGANIGLHALTFARAAGTGGHVYAFEPLTRNALLARLNAELNGLKNIDVLEIALSDQDAGVLQITLPQNDSAYAYFTPSDGRAGHGAVEVPCMRLDSWLSARNVDRVDVVKIDVEGAELRVLGGAPHLLAQLQPRVFIVEVCDEFLARFGDRAPLLFDIFTKAGYRAQKIGRHGRLAPFDELVGSMNVAFVRD